MNQFLIRILKSFKANEILNGFIPNRSILNSKDPKTEMENSLGTNREEDILILNEHIIMQQRKLKIEDLFTAHDNNPMSL